MTRKKVNRPADAAPTTAAQTKGKAQPESHTSSSATTTVTTSATTPVATNTNPQAPTTPTPGGGSKRVKCPKCLEHVSTTIEEVVEHQQAKHGSKTGIFCPFRQCTRSQNRRRTSLRSLGILRRHMRDRHGYDLPPPIWIPGETDDESEDEGEGEGEGEEDSQGRSLEEIQRAGAEWRNCVAQYGEFLKRQS